ncbi:glycosyltransferase family 2 protein [Salinarimonas sp.]|uniref:glycosyltransferase family 2 protein n=1 Tax=Salinarimonas sp. TaxID=2766526 RepID=UPI0032D99871
MTQPLPRISIVVPCFQAAATLEATLLSLFEQTYPDLQIIVMDGGSTDGSVEIIERYADRLAFWVSAKDAGQVDALNKGFAKADGDVFGWLCADDRLLPGALHRVAREFTADPTIDVVTGGCTRDFDGKSVVYTQPAPDFIERLFITNTVEQPSTFWRAALHRRIGAVDGSMRYAFDWELWCRFTRAGARWKAIPDLLSVYYFSTTNLTSTGGRKIVDEMYRIVKTYGPYKGKIADVYMFLYKTFDLRGFYDPGARETMPAWKLAIFYFVLRWLYKRYDPASINAYNWNFASRQERGLTW